jgi:hypothetical protein
MIIFGPATTKSNKTEIVRLRGTEFQKASPNLHKFRPSVPRTDVGLNSARIIAEGNWREIEEIGHKQTVFVPKSLIF